MLIFLSGCFQSTAMVGPTMTLVSTGNMGQAFGAFVTNKAVEEETGMATHEFIVKKVEEQQIKSKDKKINKELSALLENNIKNKQLLLLYLHTNYYYRATRATIILSPNTPTISPSCPVGLPLIPRNLKPKERWAMQLIDK